MTEPKSKLPRFTPANKQFIKNLILDGFTAGEILSRFKNHFFPSNNYCGTPETIRLFKVRICHINRHLDKSNEFKDLLKQAQTGLAKKDYRLLFRKDEISRVAHILSQYDGMNFMELSKDDKNAFLKLRELQIKQLQHLAIELGEFKTTSINVDQRKQLQVIQQQNVFGGQATVPHLEGDNATGLRIVAPSVKESCKQVPGESQQDNNPHPVEASPAMPVPSKLPREQVPGDKQDEIDPTAVGDSSLSPASSPAMPDKCKEVEQPPEEE